MIHCPSRWLCVDCAAAHLGQISVTTLRDRVGVRPVRIGTRVVWDREELDAWVESQKACASRAENTAPSGTRAGPTSQPYTLTWEALIAGNGRRVYATRGYRVVEGRTSRGTVSWSVEAREDGAWYPIRRRGRALKSGGHTTHARTWRTADGAREFVERRRAGEAA